MKQTFVRRMKKGILVCFLAYIALLIYVLLFAERGSFADGLNVMPFAEIRRYLTYRDTLGFRLVALNLGGNILGFTPLGFTLPVVLRWFQKWFRTIGICLIFSLSIETIQLITHVGCFDVDDIILNTLGGSIGYMLYFVTAYVRRIKHETADKAEKKS